jgi:hypothetical protein
MSELSILKQQMADDFQMTWRIMGETADRLDRRIDQVDKRVDLIVAEFQRMKDDLRGLGADTSEGLRQAMGRMRLLEERFGKFVAVLEQQTTDNSARLESPPAA